MGGIYRHNICSSLLIINVHLSNLAFWSIMTILVNIHKAATTFLLSQPSKCQSSSNVDWSTSFIAVTWLKEWAFTSMIESKMLLHKWITSSPFWFSSNQPSNYTFNNSYVWKYEENNFYLHLFYNLLLIADPVLAQITEVMMKTCFAIMQITEGLASFCINQNHAFKCNGTI